MKKVVIFLVIIGSYVWGMDYSHCQSFYKQATTTIDSTLVYSVKYNGKPHLIAFSRTPLKSSKILKYDPFLGLYLFEGWTGASYTLKPLDNYSRTKTLAALNTKQITNGKVLNFERGVFDLGKFSASLPNQSVVSNICYQIYGIYAQGQYFVPKNLIDRFLSSKGGIYGDIGVRVAQSGAFVVVEQVDLFFPKNPFLPNDKIIAINQTKIPNVATYEWNVSNLPIGSVAKVTIIRGNKTLDLNIKVGRLYGGGLIRDTFFERFGVVIDSNMVIRQIKSQLPFKLTQLSVGDKIFLINKTPIQNDSRFWHFRQLLSQAGIKGDVEFLVLHEGVEIFIRSNLK